MTAFFMCIGLAATMRFVPELIGIWVVGLAVCTAIYTHNTGQLCGLLLLVLSVAATALTGLSFFWVTVSIASLLAGLLLAQGIKNEYRLPNLIAYSGGGALLVIVCSVILHNYISKTDTIAIFFDGFFASIKAVYIDFFDRSVTNLLISELPEGISIARIQAEMLELVDAIHISVSFFLPALLVLLVGGLTYISFGLFRRILTRKKKFLVKLPTFKYLRMDRVGGWILIIAWFVPSLLGDGLASAALYNLALIITGLFTICGISVFAFMIGKHIKQKFIRILIYIFSIILYLGLGDIFATLIIMLGVIDSTLDLRNLSVKIHRG